VLCVDLGGSDHRLGYLLSAHELAALEFAQVDITDESAVDELFASWRPTNVIHLAALQVPFCKADARLGAQVNVVGTVNVFEAAKRVGLRTPLVYASSVATYDLVDGTELAPATPSGVPMTLYGVYKLANEGTARVYWHDDGVASVGLRPYVVYGVGRDQGLTAEPTMAMLDAARGRDATISYGGRNQLQFADDVAAAFIAATRSGHRGAAVLNLPGTSISMPELAEVIHRTALERVEISTGDEPLPYPDAVESSGFATIVGTTQTTPVEDGVRETMERFRALAERGLVVDTRDRRANHRGGAT
jgi:UDP-glucuronate 4-epimerase